MMIMTIIAFCVDTAAAVDTTNAATVSSSSCVGPTNGDGSEQTCTLDLTAAAAAAAAMDDVGIVEETPKLDKYGRPTCKADADGNCLDRSCTDKFPKCSEWASKGECETNGAFMLNFCIKSCQICDYTGNLTELIHLKKQLTLVGGDETLLQTPYGMTQHMSFGDEHEDAVNQVMANMTDYMEGIIFVDPAFENVKLTCKNRHVNCAFWVAIGECEANPAYMQKMCAPSCRSCHFLDFQRRCPIDKTQPVALQPGDINKLFERIISDEYYQKYTPQVLSRPSIVTDNNSNNDDQDAPWVITLDDFISPDECDRLIHLGAEAGYALSADTGRRNFDGTYQKAHHSGRTSTNAFCAGTCATDPMTIQVTERMENITGITEKNHEYIQLLRYEEGQFYTNHHDYAHYHLERQFGPRVLTILLYLNDVQEGGATDFPLLGIQVFPKRGRAVLWPSVLNDDPLAKDQRTEHAALPVIKGIKYAANAWIHQGNFKDTHAKNCM